MEGYISTLEWMVDVIVERTAQWEDEHNNGQPFTDVLSGRQVRRGLADPHLAVPLAVSAAGLGPVASPCWWSE